MRSPREHALAWATELLSAANPRRAIANALQQLQAQVDEQARLRIAAEQAEAWDGADSAPRDGTWVMVHDGGLGLPKFACWARSHRGEGWSAWSPTGDVAPWSDDVILWRPAPRLPTPSSAAEVGK